MRLNSDLMSDGGTERCHQRQIVGRTSASTSSPLGLALRKDFGRDWLTESGQKQGSTKDQKITVTKLVDHTGYAEAVICCATYDAVSYDFGAVAIVSDNARKRRHTRIPTNKTFGVDLPCESVTVGSFNASNRYCPLEASIALEVFKDD